jgi:cytolysin (calcineurin-like family phosphatase)
MKAVKEENLRGKKIIVFILVFAAVYGFTAVDEAYSDMMDREGKVGLHVRRVNSEYVTLSIFGQTVALNTKEMKEDWEEFSDTVRSGLDSASGRIRTFLGVKEEERDYTVFKTEIM